jgi:hypothetical protein
LRAGIATPAHCRGTPLQYSNYVVRTEGDNGNQLLTPITTAIWAFHISSGISFALGCTMNRTYLMQPKGTRTGFAFRIAVPSELRAKFPSPKTGKARTFIIEGLKTRDAKSAEEQAEERRRHWRDQFERAKQGGQFSLAEIDRFSRESYVALLARMEAAAKLAATWRLKAHKNALSDYI